MRTRPFIVIGVIARSSKRWVREKRARLADQLKREGYRARSGAHAMATRRRRAVADPLVAIGTAPEHISWIHV